MKDFIENLKRQAEANPIGAIVVAALLFTATGKLMDASTARYSAKTHAKEVDRRIMQSRR